MKRANSVSDGKKSSFDFVGRATTDVRDYVITASAKLAVSSLISTQLRSRQIYVSDAFFRLLLCFFLQVRYLCIEIYPLCPARCVIQ